jgi:hypothetical protein
VEVHGDDPVGPGGLDGVGAHPGPDRHPGLVLLVALGVAEVGHHHGHGGGAGALERVDPEQQLHEVVVGREGRALDEEHVALAHVLGDPHEQVALGEPERLSLAHGVVEVRRDRRPQPGIRRAHQQNEIVSHAARH